jgi:hypothetical protein
MLPFRLLVRAKVFQLVGVAAAAIPITTIFTEGGVSGLQLFVAGALVIGCGAASSALWYYSRRYIGELSLVQQSAPRRPQLCFSVLDFWGNREDNMVELEEMVPPLQNLSPSGMAEVAEQTLIPIDVAGDRQYVASLRHGHIVDKATLMQLLKGEHPEQQMPGRPWDTSN